MKQLEALGTRLDNALTQLETHTASTPAATLLGVAMGLVAIIGGLVTLVVVLKLLTALF